MSAPPQRFAVSIIGASMAPALPPGTHVLVDVTRRPRPGDVVLLRSRSALLVHGFLGWGVHRRRRYGVHRGLRPGPWGVFGEEELVGVAVAAWRRQTALCLPPRQRVLARSWWPRVLALGARLLDAWGGHSVTATLYRRLR